MFMIVRRYCLNAAAVFPAKMGRILWGFVYKYRIGKP